MEKDEKVILEIENIIRTKQVAERLNIAESTIRKYAQTLEKNTGYIFKTDENGRVFSEDDIDTLRTIKQVKDEFGVSLQRAVDIVATRKQGSTQTVAPEKVSNDGEVTAIQTRHDMEMIAALLTDFKDEIRSEIKGEIKQVVREEVQEVVREEMKLIIEEMKRLREIEKEVAAAKEREKRWYEFWK